MAQNNGVSLVKWAIGIVIAVIMALSGVFMSHQWRQDDAIAQCMGPSDRVYIQQQLNGVQKGVDRNRDLLMKVIEHQRHGR